MTENQTTINGITRVEHPHKTEFGIPYDRPTFMLNSWATVYHPQTILGGEVRNSEVSWSSIGCKSVEHTELFMEAMNQAIQLAKELDAKETTK